VPDASTGPDLVARTQHGFEAMNRRGYEGMMRFWASDVSFRSRPLGVSITGRAAVRRFAEEWIGGFDDVAFDVEELVDVGSRVTIAVVRQAARPFGTSEFIEQRDVWVSEWAAGTVTRVTAYADTDDARAAAERLAKESE
jgi:ketosteroid isomerase-like protein